jgi:hypothetical protein
VVIDDKQVQLRNIIVRVPDTLDFGTIHDDKAGLRQFFRARRGKGFGKQVFKPFDFLPFERARGKKAAGLVEGPRYSRNAQTARQTVRIGFFVARDDKLLVAFNEALKSSAVFWLQ